VKTVSKTLLAVYLLILLWLVLFKFSLDFAAILDHQARSLNLIPFATYSSGNLSEMLYNLVVFIPFGLLLGVNLKQTNFWEKLSYIYFFSFAAELTQFIVAIGTTDTTDIIMNTAGGFLGLVLYGLSKYVDSEKLDRFIVVAGTILLTVLVLFRLLFLRVRY